MMTSHEIRNAFLEFFKSKNHKIVPSAPIVVKNDPTLMFVNSGMAPFKDYFLGNQTPPEKRIADTQKCLRVSGKHNDLEEVGVDTYHHTMFEMLGNWSFGDYFKKEAIEWSWELLTKVYGLSEDRLYVTVFEGDVKENLAFDQEAYDEWKKWIAEDRILKGNKKDNFWEMGDTGPCGPCSEIHIDLRSEEDRKAIDGKDLVNASHPQVIEIWNNVFMEFERKADGSLVKLANQHVDTGMGFERLCVAIQKKTSNYDTDIFQPFIQLLSKKSGFDYHFTAPKLTADGKVIGVLTPHQKTDIALRVVADHIRTIAFTIADGQLPSNNGAGYVIRRILRRAVRYGYSYLGFEQPFMYEMVNALAAQFVDVFPELNAQKDFVAKVIQEEEASFLRTLANGINRIESLKEMDGKIAFELYDTYGFPLDLTKLIAAEKGWSFDEKGFEAEMKLQKEKGKSAAATEKSDWTVVGEEVSTEFLGYDSYELQAALVKYRKVKTKDSEVYQLVLNKTPFYAESGGQVGDTGLLDFEGEKIEVVDTKKENDLIIHFAKKLPTKLDAKVTAKINVGKRNDTIKNHSATHLLQAALRQVLGNHVQQKGSLVNSEYLRFDFSHFSKMTGEEIRKVEEIVNEKIMQNIRLEEQRNVPFQQAIDLGVTALFGEKYGEFVRVITFDKNYSSELCGGCHVPATGTIGILKITSESSTAAGVRRIEAVTGKKALEFINKKIDDLTAVSEIFNNPKNVIQAADTLVKENDSLRKELEVFSQKEILNLKNQLKANVVSINGINFLGEIVALNSNDAVKNLMYALKNEFENFVFVVGANLSGKAALHIMIDEQLVKDKNLNAGAFIKEFSSLIKGGGGGQPFYASAGGTQPEGLQEVIEKVKSKLSV
jgi:alanyl-tRNA synthetase